MVVTGHGVHRQPGVQFAYHQASTSSGCNATTRLGLPARRLVLRDDRNQTPHPIPGTRCTRKTCLHRGWASCRRMLDATPHTSSRGLAGCLGGHAGSLPRPDQTGRRGKGPRAGPGTSARNRTQMAKRFAGSAHQPFQARGDSDFAPTRDPVAGLAPRISRPRGAGSVGTDPHSTIYRIESGTVSGAARGAGPNACRWYGRPIGRPYARPGRKSPAPTHAHGSPAPTHADGTGAL